MIIDSSKTRIFKDLDDLKANFISKLEANYKDKGVFYVSVSSTYTIVKCGLCNKF